MLGKFKFCTFCGLDELFSFYVLRIFRDTEILLRSDSQYVYDYSRSTYLLRYFIVNILKNKNSTERLIIVLAQFCCDGLFLSAKIIQELILTTFNVIFKCFLRQINTIKDIRVVFSDFSCNAMRSFKVTGGMLRFIRLNNPKRFQ